MPLKFDPARHPRDRRGRFTKSRTVLASAKEKKAAREFADGFKPANAGGGKGYLSKIAEPGQRQAAGDFAAHAQQVNGDLRDGRTDTPGVKAMDEAMRPLPDDVVLYRKVPAAAFGGVDPQSLQGMKVRDAGFAPTQLEPAPADQDVHLFIAAPKGSRAVVNGDTGEVYLDRDSEMVVTHVAANSAGGHDMYLTLLPKRDAKGNGAPAGPEVAKDAARPGTKSKAPAAPKPPDKAATSEADKPRGEAEFRAQLMKQNVPALQAQMRDRGLPPARKRKSELVDALVADEMGHTSSKPGDSTPSASKVDKPAAPAPKPTAAPKPTPTPAPAKVPNGAPTVDQIRQAILDQIGEEGRTPNFNTFVMLSDVRSRLPGVSRADFDAAIRELDTHPDVLISPESNQKALNAVQRAGAVRFGGQDNHVIALGGQDSTRLQQQHPTGRKPPATPAPTDERFGRATSGPAALNAVPMGLLRRGDRKSPLAAEQRDALNSYRGASFTAINGSLRTGHAGDPRVTAIDSVMNRSKLASDVVVYRGVSMPRTMFGDRINGDMTGMVWGEDAYQSTSASQKLATSFAKDAAGRGGGLLMRILAPAGTGGVEMSGLSAESEILLERGRSMRVVHDRGVVDGVRQVDVEVVAGDR